MHLPSGLFGKVKTLVTARIDLGFRSIIVLLTKAVRKRTEKIEKMKLKVILVSENKDILFSISQKQTWYHSKGRTFSDPGTFYGHSPNSILSLSLIPFHYQFHEVIHNFTVY